MEQSSTEAVNFSYQLTASFKQFSKNDNKLLQLNSGNKMNECKNYIGRIYLCNTVSLQFLCTTAYML